MYQRQYDTNNPTHHRRLPLGPLCCLGFPGGERPAALRQKRGGGLRATGGAWGDNDAADGIFVFVNGSLHVCFYVCVIQIPLLMCFFFCVCVFVMFFFA